MTYTWALLKEGCIVNTVTTTSGLKHMQEHYPDFEIRDIYDLPEETQGKYRFWEERP